MSDLGGISANFGVSGKLIARPDADMRIKVRTDYRVECYHACLEADCAACRDGRWNACPSKWLKWTDEFGNLVTTAGLNHIISRIFRKTATGGAGGGYNDGRRYPAPWVANTSYTAGDVVRPTSGSGQLNNNRSFICKIAGTSHSSTEPTWPNTDSGTVTDNTVTWLEASQWFIGLITGPGSGNTYAVADTMSSHAGWSENTSYSDSTRQAYVPGSVSGGSASNATSVAVFNINGTATLAGCFLTDIDTKAGTLGTLYGEGNFTGGDRAVVNGDTLNVTVTTSVA